MPVLGADALVRRAVLEPARRTHAHVLVARRLLIHATMRDAVVGAEALGAHGAARRAALAAAVVVPADHQGRRRATAMRTCQHPGRPATERTLSAEGRMTSLRRLEPPLGALHQDGRLDELQRMHDGLHLAAPDFLGAATLRERRHGSNGFGVGLLCQDRFEVAVQSAKLGGERLLRRGAPRGDPLGRLLLEMAQEQAEQVAGLPRRDRACVRCDRFIRGLDAACFQVPECAGQVFIELRTGRQVVHVAFDHGLLDTATGAEHDARHQPTHRMHGHSHGAPLRGAVPHGNRQLDALRIARGARGDQAQ